MVQDENLNILPRVAVVEDMSGFGKVSLTEAIPILSAMGIETCPLPTAVLSTHTFEFKDYTLLDLTDEMTKILEHWEKLNLKFDAVYSGYMSSKRQIEITREFMRKQRKSGAVTVVDPVLGDNALLDVKTVYSERMTELIDGMRSMCEDADVITPNLTEACLLLDCDYLKGAVSDDAIKDLLFKLSGLGAKASIITSVMDTEDTMCVGVYDGDDFYKIDCGYVNRPFHGTGDIFTSVLTGAILQGRGITDAANVAADFVYEAIQETIKYPQIPIRHGVLFETVLRDGYFAKKNITDRVKRI